MYMTGRELSSEMFRFKTSTHPSLPQVHSPRSSSTATSLPFPFTFATVVPSLNPFNSFCILISFCFSRSSVNLASKSAARLAGRSIGAPPFTVPFAEGGYLYCPLPRSPASPIPAAAPAMALNCDWVSLGSWSSWPSAEVDQLWNAERKFGSEVSMGPEEDGSGKSGVDAVPFGDKTVPLGWRVDWGGFDSLGGGRLFVRGFDRPILGGGGVDELSGCGLGTVEDRVSSRGFRH